MQILNFEKKTFTINLTLHRFFAQCSGNAIARIVVSHHVFYETARICTIVDIWTVWSPEDCFRKRRISVYPFPYRCIRFQPNPNMIVQRKCLKKNPKKSFLNCVYYFKI